MLYFLVSVFEQFDSIGFSCRLWGTLLADVVIQMLGTDYARILRAIYAFAQVMYDLVCMILKLVSQICRFYADRYDTIQTYASKSSCIFNHRFGCGNPLLTCNCVFLTCCHLESMIIDHGLCADH